MPSGKKWVIVKNPGNSALLPGCMVNRYYCAVVSAAEVSAAWLPFV